MRNAHSIALVGMPGGGKSTIGRQLAKRLSWQFADTDALVEKRVGLPVRAIFEIRGEFFFREIEASVIDEITMGRNTVIATGGGAVLAEKNRQLFRSHCHVVYLRSSPEELYRRLQNDNQRPLLQVAQPLERLQELFVERDPLYRELADSMVDTGRSRIQSVVDAIAAQLALAGLLDPSTRLSAVPPPLSNT